MALIIWFLALVAAGEYWRISADCSLNTNGAGIRAWSSSRDVFHYALGRLAHRRMDDNAQAGP